MGQNPLFCTITTKMKDRIKKIMESQHMTQQVFADFLGIGAATLSGIFNDRTKPTINIIEAIKKKLPTLSTDWLMFGIEPMYTTTTEQPPTGTPNTKASSSGFQETLIDFNQPLTPTPQSSSRPMTYGNGVRNTRPETEIEFMKNFDKNPRRVTEIRVFYDDQTWESFVPAKK